MTEKMSGQQIILCLLFQELNYKEPLHMKKCHLESLFFKTNTCSSRAFIFLHLYFIYITFTH